MKRGTILIALITILIISLPFFIDKGSAIQESIDCKFQTSCNQEIIISRGQVILYDPQDFLGDEPLIDFYENPTMQLIARNNNYFFTYNGQECQILTSNVDAGCLKAAPQKTIENQLSQQKPLSNCYRDCAAFYNAFKNDFSPRRACPQDRGCTYFYNPPVTPQPVCFDTPEPPQPDQPDIPSTSTAYSGSFGAVGI